MGHSEHWAGTVGARSWDLTMIGSPALLPQERQRHDGEAVMASCCQEWETGEYLTLLEPDMSITLEPETEKLLEAEARRKHQDKAALANSFLRERLEAEALAAELDADVAAYERGELETVSMDELAAELRLDDDD